MHMVLSRMHMQHFMCDNYSLSGNLASKHFLHPHQSPVKVDFTCAEDEQHASAFTTLEKEEG